MASKKDKQVQSEVLKHFQHLLDAADAEMEEQANARMLEHCEEAFQFVRQSATRPNEKKERKRELERDW